MTMHRANVPLSAGLRAEVLARGEEGDAIGRDLARYYALLAEAKRAIAPVFSPQELAFIDAATNFDAEGDAYFGTCVRELHTLVTRALTRAEAPAGVDETILAKIDALSDVERMALVDALEIWRVENSRKLLPTVKELMQQPGAVRSTPLSRQLWVAALTEDDGSDYTTFWRCQPLPQGKKGKGQK